MSPARLLMGLNYCRWCSLPASISGPGLAHLQSFIFYMHTLCRPRILEYIVPGLAHLIIWPEKSPNQLQVCQVYKKSPNPAQLRLVLTWPMSTPTYCWVQGESQSDLFTMIRVQDHLQSHAGKLCRHASEKWSLIGPIQLSNFYSNYEWTWFGMG